MANKDGVAFAPGRSGQPGGPAGVRVRAHKTRLLASVLARPGSSSLLATATERSFGLTLPTTPRVISSSAACSNFDFVWSGPGHWLVESSAAGATMDELLTAFDGSASVFDQTDSRVLLDVSGPRIRDALAKGLPIDLHPTSFKVGDAAITKASHIGLQIWQLAPEPLYRLAVARSYFISFWGWLSSSAAEYGCEISESA